MWTSSRGGFRTSLAQAGNPHENAMMESFFKTLKCGEVNLCEYETFEDLVRRLPYFLEEVYNKKRFHLAFGYLPSTDFEELALNQENNGLTRHPSCAARANPTCPIMGVQSVLSS